MGLCNALGATTLFKYWWDSIGGGRPQGGVMSPSGSNGPRDGSEVIRRARPVLAQRCVCPPPMQSIKEVLQRGAPIHSRISRAFYSALLPDMAAPLLQPCV